jgi:hypothetical protein
MSPTLALYLEQTPGVQRPPATDSSTRTRGAAGAVTIQPRASNGGFFRGLFGRGAPTGTARPDGKQVIAGAEAMMNVHGARGLQVRRYFEPKRCGPLTRRGRINIFCFRTRTTRSVVFGAFM